MVLSLPDVTNHLSAPGHAFFLAVRYTANPSDTIVFDKGITTGVGDDMHLYVVGAQNLLFMRAGGGGTMYNVTPDQVGVQPCTPT